MENAEDARWLEAIHIKGWLDLQIRIHDDRLKSYEFNDHVRLYIPEDPIPMGSGIDYVTGLLGIELKEEFTNNNIFPFLYSFEYNGKKFVHLSEKRIFPGAVEDRERM